MLRVGITGHIDLAEQARRPVLNALIRALQHCGPLPVHGVTCLAEGADQLFVSALLQTRGTFEVILPALDYREKAISPANTRSFDDLLGKASRVSYAPFTRSGPVAYAAANKALLRRADLLFAVWDGKRGRAEGTASVVARAYRRGLAVTRIWPPGAVRR